ncbi:GIY-YIG nuclease family protein [Dyella solisilvae]|uniref:GIY-YIG nuclease family protein n=1 Tax=Dyella solisilvae TaxID=1920168 RepID=A0A370KBA6_9GAMM|nr:GIY-YIG nuclease family protein [Dyella solisilvae]RDI99938.1 GIY-YIG nuclease family protein [Dyella solisilvae]
MPHAASDQQSEEPRFASRGRAYVYVLPCRDADLLKVGFSRDPMQRLHDLHPRFFEFFDLGRGLLIEVDLVAQARRIERHFLTRWPECRAPAPLAVHAAAGGRTEWYRGVDAELTALARELAREESLPLHEPLRDWLARRLADRAGLLYDWSERMLAEASLEREHHGAPGPFEHALLDTLSLCEAVGLPLEQLLPASVLAWHRFGPHRRLFEP